MPCSSDGYDLAEKHELRLQVDHLTRLLCSACQYLEVAEVEMPAELDVWWEAHKLADKKREIEARQQLEQAMARKEHQQHLNSVRARLLTQLTEDEKEALGLQ